ncbi:MAG: helix-turn-helix domain-containing protein [PVC group bacterium]|nr:helix-turn-helix domain-containing protein [PVC group bacterium]
MKYLKPDELCELFQIKKNKLYKMTSQGIIPFFRIGRELRFDLASVRKRFEINNNERRTLL